MCSGGSLLGGNSDDPTLLGVCAQNEERDALLVAAIAAHRVNKASYDEVKWANRYIPLAGEFLETVLRAVDSGATR
jgi:hypothetical protein